MSSPEVVALIIVVALILYVLMGGADFGGGVWDLLARGPRAEAQRSVISHAIAPIWEANHVWMIVAIVLLFTSFPPAFSVIMTALHVPILLMLVGIVMRGSAFVFRKADPRGDSGSRAWQRVFAVSSLITPVMIGLVLGTITVPGIGYAEGVVTGGFFGPWLRPFPWAVGAFTLVLFAWLAACYLTLETKDPELVEDFRVRALWSGWAVAGAGAAVIAVGLWQAPEVVRHFGETWEGGTLLLLGAAGIVWAQWKLHTRGYVGARFGAWGAAVSILAGWAVGQEPYLVYGAVTIEEAAAPAVTHRLVLWILGVGTLILAPAFVYLYATFKGDVLFRRDRD